MSDETSESFGQKVGTTHTVPQVSILYRNYVLLVLTLVYTANVADRQILAILIEPIKHELVLSDTQLGLLTGLAFAIFHSLFGIPIAMWADRGNRRNIITLALTVFSCMTVLAGFVTNFIQLMLARIGVAIGESGGSPPSHSMIADLFPAEKRTAALGFYAMSANIGTLVGFLIGGWIDQWYGWRWAFFAMGVPGLIIALILRFTVREPIRGHADGLAEQGKESAPSLIETLRFLWSQRSFRHLAVATTLVMTAGIACFTWLPAFFTRSFSMSSGEVGTSLALTLGIVGGIGAYTIGHISNFFGRRDVRWNLWCVAIAYTLAAPFWIAMYTSDSKTVALMFFLYPAFATGCWMASSFSMAQALVPVRMRTRASAVLYLILSLVGGSIGPQLTGTLSDFYSSFSGKESLRYALLTSSFAYLWSAVHFYLASRTLKDDIARVREYRA